MHEDPASLRHDDSILNCCLFFHHDMPHILAEAERRQHPTLPSPRPSDARKFQPRVILISRDRNFLQKASFNDIETLLPTSLTDFTLELSRKGLLAVDQMPPDIRREIQQEPEPPSVSRVHSSPSRMEAATPTAAPPAIDLDSLLRRSNSTRHAEKTPSKSDHNKSKPNSRLIASLLTPPQSNTPPHPNKRALNAKFVPTLHWSMIMLVKCSRIGVVCLKAMFRLS